MAETFCLQPGCYAVPPVASGDPVLIFTLIHLLAVATLAVSFVCSAYIILRCVLWDRRYRTVGQRFPIYLSVFDMCWSICHSADHLVILLPKRYPEALASEVLGASLQLFLVGPAILVAVISASTYMSVFHQWQINFGRFDWQLMALCVGVPVAMVAAGLPLGVFGPSGYWNYLRLDSARTQIYMLIWSTIPLILNFSITLFCSTAVSRYVRSNTLAVQRFTRENRRKAAKLDPNEHDDSDLETASVNSNEQREHAHVIRAADRMNQFALIFLIQWTPLVAFTIAAAVDFANLHWLWSLFIVTLTNAGGIMNFAAFVRLFGFRSASATRATANTTTAAAANSVAVPTRTTGTSGTPRGAAGTLNPRAAAGAAAAAS